MRITLLACGLALLSSAAMAQAPAAPPPPAAAAAAPLPPQGPVIFSSAEYRFQLDLAVDAAELAKLLPAGWTSNVAAQGPAKDANLRLIFVDAMEIEGPDNRVLGKGVNRIAMLAAPVKNAAGATAQVIVGGIAEDVAAAPDAFGVYLPAAGAKAAHAFSTVGGVTTATEDWDFTAAGGEHLAMHLKFTKSAANRGIGATVFYNPADPTKYVVSHTDGSTDITRNVTTNPPDRVQEFTLTASGGKYAALLNGAKPLSWDSQPVFSRTVNSAP
jgi:hypothetical protein